AAAELGAAAPDPGATFRLQSTRQDATILAALRARDPQRIFVEHDDGTSLKVHPPLFGDVLRSGDALTIPASPDDDEAVLLDQLTAELRAILAEQGDLAAVEVTLAWPGAAPTDPVPARCIEALLAAPPQGPSVLRWDD